MDRELKLKFARTLKSMEGKNYIQSMIAFCAAPTIKGKKPSSLMSFNTQGKNTMSLWRRYGREVCELFELHHFELKNGNNGIVVLFYRKNMLEQHINQRCNQPFLKSRGYGFTDDLDEKLEILKQRFEKLCPHEVGIFLGIPVEDVEGFIDHKGKNYLLCRYWKVYGDPQCAEVLFKDYDTARSSMAHFVIDLKSDSMAECI